MLSSPDAGKTQKEETAWAGFKSHLQGFGVLMHEGVAYGREGACTTSGQRERTEGNRKWSRTLCFKVSRAEGGLGGHGRKGAEAWERAVSSFGKDFWYGSYLGAGFCFAVRDKLLIVSLKVL